MKKLMFVASLAMFVAPTLAEAQISADRLGPCSAGQVQVCHKSVNGEWWPMIVRGDPAWDCSVESDAPIALQCVSAAYVCGLAKNDCRDLGERWRWSESTCDCIYQGRRSSDNGSGNGSAGGHDGATTVAHYECNAAGLAGLEVEMDRIADAVHVVLDLRTLQLRATAVYDRLLECRVQNGASPELDALVERAADLIATFEPEPTDPPHDYHDEFQSIRDQIADLESTAPAPPSPSEGNWCDENPVACGFLIAGAILAGGAIVVGGVCGAGYCEDDPGLPDHIFY